jgi:hypothetical protein
MGFDLRWIGVEGRYRERLLDWLDLEQAGDAGDELGSEFTLAEAPGGWVVLVANAPGFILDDALAGVSSSCGFAVGCEIVEAVTFSQARAWRDGRPAWSVTYDGDKGPDGLEVDGDPPPEFAAIRSRRNAEQAADPDPSVSYMFEAPLDLAAGIAGYRPGEYQGLEWAILRRKRAKDRPSVRRPRSLRTAMLSELLPLLRSLGWQMGDRPALADSNQIYRSLNGLHQTLWFDFASGQETYIIVYFAARAPAGEPEFVVRGRVTAPRLTLPLWKRFSWKRFSELTRYYPPPEDIVGATIERARDEIIIADEYLRAWAPSPCIRIEFARPDVQWPSPDRMPGAPYSPDEGRTARP